MEIIEKLVQEYQGIYHKEPSKETNTPSGKLSSQNSYGVIKRNEYQIHIYGFVNSGIRMANTVDGSPFKIVLMLPFRIESKISIFPKSFLQKLFTSSRKALSADNKLFLKKYRLTGSKSFQRSFLSSDLPLSLKDHLVYISSNVGENSTDITLRPNESVITKADLEKLFLIMDNLGRTVSGKASQ